MLLFRDLTDVTPNYRGSVLAMGNFDGLHRGHRAVLETARDLAEQEGRPLAVMTFSPHPRRFFKPDLPPLKLMPLADKARRLRDMGVDALWVARFDDKLSRMRAQEFLDLLAGPLQVAHLVTGENFVFGHGREGDMAFLQAHAPAAGLKHHAVSAVTVDGTVCSSTAVRTALAAGECDTARRLLGRAYTIRGRVVAGDRRGRTLGYPTANMRLRDRFRPRFGVYIAELKTADGTCYRGVANLGIRPMYESAEPLLETHLFDVSPNLYGQVVEMSLHAFLRDEMRLENAPALIAQMDRDSDAARRWWEGQEVKHYETVPA